MSLPDDLRRFFDLDLGHDAMAIGRSIKVYPGRVRHWANVDGADSKWWAEHLPYPCTRHTMGDCEGYDVDWDIKDCPLPMEDVFWHGSTSLFAVYIGLAMGYRKLVLAGCPLDENGHWYFKGLSDNKGPRWKEQSYKAWHEFRALPESGQVRSYSGFTAEILGQPDLRWFHA